MGIVTDEISRRVLVNLSREAGWSEKAVRLGGLKEALDCLTRVSTPCRLLVDLSESQAPLDDIAQLAGVCDPGTHVIAIGTVNDVDLFRKLIGCGVADYLVKPVGAEALKQAIMAPEPTVAAPPRGCRLVAMIGSRGGVGTTLVATCTAWL